MHMRLSEGASIRDWAAAAAEAEAEAPSKLLPNCTWHFAAQTEIGPTNNIGFKPSPGPVDSGLPWLPWLLLLKWLNQQTAGRIQDAHAAFRGGKYSGLGCSCS